MCERKKKKENERWATQLTMARKENEVWVLVNRERKRRRKVNEAIGKEEWKEHYIRLLGE